MVWRGPSNKYLSRSSRLLFCIPLNSRPSRVLFWLDPGTHPSPFEATAALFTNPLSNAYRVYNNIEISAVRSVQRGAWRETIIVYAAGLLLLLLFYYVVGDVFNLSYLITHNGNLYPNRHLMENINQLTDLVRGSLESPPDPNTASHSKAYDESQLTNHSSACLLLFTWRIL